ncbi:WAT1-related protein [Vitis vinifera]|uniref:WAT1-related protein n=1 Tax=Vitis vinifera TaxID=29760 RepID=A0A438H8P5_VITVI|nr:WAT1-related protein [Vitis vinifera]
MMTMELQRRLAMGFQISKPYLFLTLNELALSVFLVLVESLASSGISTLVIVVYEHVLATIVLSLLSFFFEKNKRPPITFKILCYAFLMGLLQKAKIQEHQWAGQDMGLGISLGGALALVLWKGPVVVKAMLSISFDTTSDSVLGWIMTIVGVLATSFWKYFGEACDSNIPSRNITNSNDELLWNHPNSHSGSLCGLILSLGTSVGWRPNPHHLITWGIVVTGLSYYVMTWSIGIKGPVFSASFNPLLVLFSFLLNTFVLVVQPIWAVVLMVVVCSIVGAVLVIVGLYLLLWAKANDVEKKDMDVGDSTCSPLIQP